MTSPKAISFLVGVLLLGTILSFVMGGVWFDNATQTIFGALTAFKVYNVLGFHMPWVNIDFFTIGLPHLFSFDFAFFGGSYSFFKYGMYIFSIGIIWGIVGVFVYVISSFKR